MKHHTSFSQAHRGLAVVALASLATALVGCSGEPSAGDVDKTVRAYMSDSQAQLQKLTGTKGTLGEVHEVNKLGCKSETDKSYRCDIELDVTQFGNRKKGPASFRFTKGSDGWLLSN
jgi:hypothetical protein